MSIQFLNRIKYILNEKLWLQQTVQKAYPILCAGRARSEIPAITKDHFQAGAQKKTVCKFVSWDLVSKNLL